MSAPAVPPPCSACGSKEPGERVSIYGQIYLPPKDGRHLRALPKIVLCKRCFAAFLAGRITGVPSAIRRSYKAGYNAIKGARAE